MMLVNTKAKVGVFSIALGAYLPQFPSLVPEFEEQYEAFKKTIPDSVEVIDGGMATTKEQSQAAGDLFRARMWIWYFYSCSLMLPLIICFRQSGIWMCRWYW